MVTKTKGKAKPRTGSMPPNRGKGWHFLSWGNRSDMDKSYRKQLPAPRYELLVIPAWPSAGSWKYGLWYKDHNEKPKKN